MARVVQPDGWEAILSKIQSDPETTQTSLKDLKKYVRQNVPGRIDGKDIEDWYKRQEVNQQRPFGIFHNSYKPHEAREETNEDPNRFLLVAVDPFTSYIWAEQVNSKESNDVLAGFKKIIDKMGIPANIASDLGGEFVGKLWTKELTYYDIKHLRFRTHLAFVERAIRTLKLKIHTLIKNATKSTAAADEYVDWWKYLPRALKIHNVEKLSTVTQHTPQELHERFDKEGGDEQLRRVVRARLEKVSSMNQKYVPISVGDLVKVRAKHSPTDNVSKIEFKRNVYRVKEIEHTGMGPLFELEVDPNHEPVENFNQVIYDPPDFKEDHPHKFLRHELLKVSASETPYHAVKPFSEIEKRLREQLRNKADELQRILETKGGTSFELSLGSAQLRAFFESVKQGQRDRKVQNPSSW